MGYHTNAEDEDNNSITPHQARDNIGELTGRPARALQSRASFLNGRPSYLLYFWEVADAHQLLQSSLQRLTNNTGASDASCAPTTSSISTSGSRIRRRSHRQEQEQDEASLFPLVQSIKDLADCQKQLAFDQAEERRSERHLDFQRHQMETQDRQRERCFRRRAELNDLARKYRKLNAELNPNDENSQRLSDFYIAETNDIARELQELDNEQQL